MRVLFTTLNLAATRGCKQQMSALHIAYISVGSNLGNKLENCRQGIQSLTQSNARLTAQSHIYQTEPVDYKDQDWFINYAVEIETDLDPFQLMERIQKIQRKAGRTHNKIRFGPRILDLDIILYEDVVICSPQLTIPHPRMHERRFVLQPLCDIDSTILHPVLRVEVQSLLNTLDDKEQRIRHYR